MTTLDQMAKAAYEATIARCCRDRGMKEADFKTWEELPEQVCDANREAIRAALRVIIADGAEVKPDAVTQPACVHEWETVGGVNTNYRLYFNGSNAYIRCVKCGQRQMA